MPAGVRRSLEELLQRYKREPSIVDVFVEGEADREFMSWLLGSLRNEDAKVYLIESVSVPAQHAIALDGEDNNRGRLVALAALVCPHISNSAKNFTAVIDNDLACVTGARHTCIHLLTTDYCDATMYATDRTAIFRALKDVAYIEIEDDDALWKSVTEIGTEIFLFRAANCALGLGLKKTQFIGCCSLEVKNSKVRHVAFNRDEYIRRYLGGSQLLHQRDEFLARVEEIRKTLPGDFRLRCNGHDFFALLAFIVKSASNERWLASERCLFRVLSGLISRSGFAAEPMLNALLNRLAG